MFKLVKGKDGTTSFLPIESKTGGKISYIKSKEAICLKNKQTTFIKREKSVKSLMSIQ